MKDNLILEILKGNRELLLEILNEDSFNLIKDEVDIDELFEPKTEED